MDQAVTASLLAWYKKNKRELPWRNTHDPYAVIVSEMMLQQTQVNTVIDYYNRFLKQFPDFKALAISEEQEVLSVWQGLGYYSRARNLHQLAKTVMEAYSGSLPRTYEALIKLPGIGPYMAGAVMSIGFDIPMPAVDGNVLRVVSRIDGLDEDIAKPAARQKITERVAQILPQNHAGDFTQAMMELGAVVCRPKSPDCGVCPVQIMCTAFQQGLTDRLPVKTPKEKPKTVKLSVYLITTPDAVLMHYRAEQGLLARMWGLPVSEDSGEPSALEWISGLNGPAVVDLGHIRHTFTHQRWEMEVFWYQTEREYPVEPPYLWQRLDALDKLPVAVAFKKVLTLIPASD